ncbi:MAG: hypothetical protein JRC86_09245 [Deltaproteobacteria bacterium]|nr:hypothetical protein [Deltaproteobacteria bacterium]
MDDGLCTLFKPPPDLSAIERVQAKFTPSESYRGSEIAVVSLAIPIIVGLATIGTLLVLEAEMVTSIEKMIGTIALIAAIASIGMILSGIRHFFTAG